MNKGLLLSGGMDSICLAYWLKPQYAFTIDYGQKPAIAEMRVSKTVCDLLKIHHIPLVIDCSTLGSGDLSGKKPLDLSPSTEWWPFRNQLLVRLAAMKAVSLEIDELIVGSVKNDNFHIDGTEPFYEKINNLMILQEGNIRVSAPAVNMSTLELIQESMIPMNILSWAHSCHKSIYPCGSCRGCDKYMFTMQKLGYN